MFLKPINVKAKLVIICVVINLFITGCKETKNTDESSTHSNNPNEPGFVLDFEELTEPQVLKSELFLSSVHIEQYHVGQQEPTMYEGKDISGIIFYYRLFPDTKEWALTKMDIRMKDGSVKSENPFKGWAVTLRIDHGRGPNPISIEKHFQPMRFD